VRSDRLAFGGAIRYARCQVSNASNQFPLICWPAPVGDSLLILDCAPGLENRNVFRIAAIEFEMTNASWISVRSGQFGQALLLRSLNGIAESAAAPPALQCLLGMASFPQALAVDHSAQRSQRASSTESLLLPVERVQHSISLEWHFTMVRSRGVYRQRQEKAAVNLRGGEFRASVVLRKTSSFLCLAVCLKKSGEESNPAGIFSKALRAQRFLPLVPGFEEFGGECRLPGLAGNFQSVGDNHLPDRGVVRDKSARSNSPDHQDERGTPGFRSRGGELHAFQNRSHVPPPSSR
jgi:hypothetical protein